MTGLSSTASDKVQIRTGQFNHPGRVLWQLRALGVVQAGPICGITPRADYVA
jgi:hypothetical protein